MESAVSFLSFGLQLSVCQALVCPAPFKDILGVCLHFRTTTMTWCDAQKYCLSQGGELVRGSNFLLLNGKYISGMPKYWIGLTDLLIERRKKKNGWRWSDGAVDPPSSELDWFSGQPRYPNEDCAYKCHNSVRLCDLRCNLKHIPMCQPRSQPSSADRSNFFQIGLHSFLVGRG